MPINQRLSKALESLKLTQTEFARQMNIDRSKASRLYNGVAGIDTEILQKLRINYSISLDWLVCGIGKMKATETAIVEEPEVLYEKNIDKEIQAMRETIETQKKLILMQEQIISKYEKETKQDRQAG